MALLGRLRKSKPQQWDAYDELWGGWNYPEPIIPEWNSSYPPDDGYLKHLIYMAEYGWHYYQKAIISMAAIHPLADYKPVIHDEFRETFNARFDDKPMTLTIYERDDKLITSNDWEAYWMYRERQDLNAYCIILGHFNQNPDIAVCDRPFQILRPDFAEEPSQPLTTF